MFADQRDDLVRRHQEGDELGEAEQPQNDEPGQPVRRIVLDGVHKRLPANHAN